MWLEAGSYAVDPLLASVFLLEKLGLVGIEKLGLVGIELESMRGRASTECT